MKITSHEEVGEDVKWAFGVRTRIAGSLQPG